MNVTSFLARSDPRDTIPIDQYGGVAEHLDLRQLSTPPGAGGAAARDDVPSADQERRQSFASNIGRRSPSRRAVAIASG